MSSTITEKTELTARLELTASDVDGIAAVVDEALIRFRSPENEDYLDCVRTYAQELPRRVRQFLTDFALTEPAAGCVISGWPVDQELAGRTPSHWRLRASRPQAVREEFLLTMYGSLVGDIFAWETQQDGTIVHDVLPIAQHENEQLGTGSKQLLWWHTEDAFHPFRGDYVGLFCIRNPDGVATTIASADHISLSPEHLERLFERRYTIRPDESHLAKNSARGGGGDAFDAIARMNENPEPVAVLFGSPDSPYLRLDPYFMDPPGDPQDREAFEALVSTIDENLSEVVLDEGDCLLIDNYRCVHGRAPFTARYDGNDRWLKRVNVTRDLRRSRHLRPAAHVRTIRGL